MHGSAHADQPDAGIGLLAHYPRDPAGPPSLPIRPALGRLVAAVGNFAMPIPIVLTGDGIRLADTCRAMASCCVRRGPDVPTQLMYSAGNPGLLDSGQRQAANIITPMDCTGKCSIAKTTGASGGAP